MWMKASKGCRRYLFAAALIINIRKNNVIEFLYIIAKTVSVILGVVSFAMLVRFVLGLFVDPMESRAYEISCYFTEPFIAPIRGLMMYFDIGQDSPIDWAFSITYLLIIILRSILPAI